MKKIFYLLFIALLGAGMIACGDDDPKPRGGGDPTPTPTPDPEPSSDVYEFTATDFWCGYYGDMLGNGTAFYTIELSEGDIDDEGYLTSYGNAVTLALSGKLPAKGETITLPVGTYKMGLQDGQEYNIYPDYYGYVVSFYEFWDEGEESSYFDFISDGTLNVKNNGDGTYTFVAELDLYYYNDNGDEVTDGSVKCSYTGPIAVQSYVEEDPYELIDADVNLGEMTDAAGTFYVFSTSGLSNYYLTLFNAPIDWNEDVFIGEGYAMTIDLFTDYTASPDLSQLNATFEYTAPGEYEEWKYQGGSVSKGIDEYYWDGTYLDQIVELEDEEGKYFGYGPSAMVTGGTIEATSDGETVNFKLNLATEAGKTITGSYSGKPQIVNKGSIEAVKARKIAAQKMMRPFSRYAVNHGKKAAKGISSLSRSVLPEVAKSSSRNARR